MSVRRLSDNRIGAKGMAPAGARVLDRWAVVSGGLVSKYVKSDGSLMEVHTFSSGGTLMVDSPGLAEVLCVAGGGAGAGVNPNGVGGRVVTGLFRLLAGAQTVIVGAGGTYNVNGGNSGHSAIGAIVSAGLIAAGSGYGAGATSSDNFAAVPVNIDGTARQCGGGYNASAGPGKSGQDSGNGTAGLVIVAVCVN